MRKDRTEMTIADIDAEIAEYEELARQRQITIAQATELPNLRKLRELLEGVIRAAGGAGS